MTRTSSRRFGRRVATGVLAAAAVATMAAWSVGTPASAGSLMASTTYLSTAISEDGQQLTMTVTVRDGNNAKGLGITPQGTVHFSDDLGDDLGSVTLPGCLLKACVATHVVPLSNVSENATQLRATYSGDLILKPSTGVDPFSYDQCDPNDGCWENITVPGAEMTVSSGSTQGYIVSNFDADGLPCGVTGGGPVGHVVGVDLNGDKSVYYMLDGAGALAYHNMLSNGNFSYGDSTHWFCYVSKDIFQAYSPDGYHTDFPESDASFATLGDAPQIVGGPYDGYYVGLLPDCPSYDVGYDAVQPHADSADPADGPCIDSFDLGQTESGAWDLSVYLTTPPGDPFLGGKKLLAPKKA